MYAELSLHKLKICAEEIEKCEKKLKRSQTELYELEIAEIRKNPQAETIPRLRRQQERLIWALKNVNILKTELYNIIYLYDKCGRKLSAKLKKTQYMQ